MKLNYNKNPFQFHSVQCVAALFGSIIYLIIHRPLKLFKENLTISNLISSFKFKPTI